MTQPAPASTDPRKRLESLLTRGEVVRWSAGSDPDLRRAARAIRRLGAWAPLALGALALGIAAALTILRPVGGYEADQTPLAIALFGGFFLAYGALRGVMQARARAVAAQRFYVITDKRVIAIDGATTLVIAPDALRSVMPIAFRGGSGDVHVWYRPQELDTGAEDVSVIFRDVPAVDRAREAIEVLARSHGVEISDDGVFMLKSIPGQVLSR
jgi:hypothetical protein